MDAIERIYLDTNIFIMAVEGDNEEIGRKLNDLFLVDHAHSPILVTSQLSFSELVVKPYSERNDPLIDRYENMMMSSDWLEVVPIEMPILRYAAVLRSQYKSLKLPDAIHLSTAIGVKCSHFLTNDLGIREQYHLVHERYGFAKRADPIKILRPDEVNLTSILESLSR